MEFLSIRMGEFPARLGSHLVNTAVVIGSQKFAWHRLQHIIIVLINSQVGLDKMFGLHPKMFGNPFDVLVREQWPGGLAAVGTAKTIGSVEFVFMKFPHQHVQMFWRPFLQHGKKLFVFLLRLLCLLRKVFYYGLHFCVSRTHYFKAVSECFGLQNYCLESYSFIYSPKYFSGNDLQ